MANPIYHSQYTAAQIEALISHGTPIIQNGTWWTWDISAGAYVDTGMTAEGAEAWRGIANEYDEDSVYWAGNYCIYNGVLYICTASTYTTGDFDPTKWSQTTVATHLETQKRVIDGSREVVNQTVADIATVENSTASKAYDVGEYLMKGIPSLTGVYIPYLCRVTAPIAQGGTITIDTNCVVVKLTDEMPRKSGTYTYPDITAGFAQHLISSVGFSNSAPYLFRAIPSGAGNMEQLRGITGATIGWNQLIRNGNFASTDYWFVGNNLPEDNAKSSIAAADNVLTQTFLVEETGSFHLGIAQRIIIDRSSDVFLFTGKIKVAQGTKYTVLLSSDTSSGRVIDVVANQWTDFSVILHAPTNLAQYSYIYFYPRTDTTVSVNEQVQFKDINAHNVSLALGSDIADYAYNLDSVTQGSGVAWLRSYGFFPGGVYHAYDAGSLQSVKLSAHKTVGFNQWNEQWRHGYYRETTGEFVAQLGGTTLANSTPIPALPSTMYYAVYPSSIQDWYFTIFEYDASGRFLRRTSILHSLTTLPETAFICFHVAGYGETYNYDICINISDASRNGQYEPYDGHTYPLDSTVEWRGIYKLDSSNNIYADGDLYPPSGHGTRNYGYRDYEAGDESLADAITDGTHTVYKLTTPTTETADAYQLNQSIEAGGTEEFTDAAVAAGTRDVSVPPGTDSFYPLDAAQVLDAPTTDGTYTLSVTVSGGVPTYSWVSV